MTAIRNDTIEHAIGREGLFVLRLRHGDVHLQGTDAETVTVTGEAGTALDDAWAFGQWAAARRLVERGARPTLLAAGALGLPLGADGDVTHTFWAACHGGQRACAEALLARGADPFWVGWDDLTPEGAARRSGAVELADWVASLPPR